MMRRIDAVLGGAFVLLLAGGYLHGDVQRAFSTATPAHRQAAERRSLGHLSGSDAAFDAAADRVTTTAHGSGDSLTWKQLAAVKARGGAGGLSVDYGALRALDGRDVTITGYMFPLQGAEEQDRFILSAWPPSCPYCLPGGPAEMMDVKAAVPVRFTYAPVTLHGRLHLQVGDGVFYAMTEAHGGG